MSYTVKTAIKKILLGTVLVLLAAAVALFIKENLDVKDPESALPSLSVTVNDMTLSSNMVFRAGYEWNFWATVERHTPEYSPSDITSQVYPVDIAPRSVMQLNFSLKCKHLKVSRANDSPDFTRYIQLENVDPANIITPASPGCYMYKVEADFGWRGSVIYYLMLNVKENA